MTLEQIRLRSKKRKEKRDKRADAVVWQQKSSFLKTQTPLRSRPGPFSESYFCKMCLIIRFFFNSAKPAWLHFISPPPSDLLSGCRKSTKASQNVATTSTCQSALRRRGWRRWWWGGGGVVVVLLALITHQDTHMLPHCGRSLQQQQQRRPRLSPSEPDSKGTLCYRRCQANRVIVTCVFLRTVDKLYFLDGLHQWSFVIECQCGGNWIFFFLVFGFLDIGAVSCHECKPATQMLLFLIFWF